MALSEKTALRLWASVAAIEDHPAEVVKFAQDVEAEVRKDYEALIQQLVEALEVATTPLAADRQEVLRAVTAAKARLAKLEN